MTINALVHGGWSGRRRWAALAAAGVGLALLAWPGAGMAAIYSYVDWMTADVPMGTAAGTITLPDSSTVSVTFAAINKDGTPGSLYGAQVIEGETNYWNPAAPYISAEVENAPPGTDILQLLGGLDQTYKVTLSEPIKDPVMAIVSLGSPSITITYDFDSPFTIVSQGAGYWGGGPAALVQLPDDVLQGTEGHGTIRFIGTFSTFSWTVPMPEGWHGFTFAIRTTERIEPTEAGAPDALTDAGEPDAPPDAAAPVDVATDSKRTTSEGGCNCAVSGPDRGAGALAVVALLALIALRARRRRQ